MAEREEHRKMVLIDCINGCVCQKKQVGQLVRPQRDNNTIDSNNNNSNVNNNDNNSNNNNNIITITIIVIKK
ncbi:unnamed protein product [Closterium sp. NIES-53]